MLLRAGIIDEEKLESAFDYQRNQGGKVYGALVKLEFLDEDDLVEFLSRQLGLPTVSLDEIDVDPDAVKLIAAQKAQKYMAIPYSQVNSSLHVAMADPTDLNAIDDIKFMTNLSVEVSIATETQIRKALDIYYDSGLQVEDMLEEFGDDELEAISGEISDLDPTIPPSSPKRLRSSSWSIMFFAKHSRRKPATYILSHTKKSYGYVSASTGPCTR